MELRSDADLQAIQTSVAFKNISDAVEQYRRQFGLAFLALVAFSAIHVGLVVIANLYTMQTKIQGGVMTDAADPSVPVATGESRQTFDLAFIMNNLQDNEQLKALSELRSASFVDKAGSYRQYTVTGFQLGGWKRSELKLYTSVGHILEYVRGRGVSIFSETGSTSTSSANSTGAFRRGLLQKGGEKGGNFVPAGPTVPIVNVFTGVVTTVTQPSASQWDSMSDADMEAWNNEVLIATYGSTDAGRVADSVTVVAQSGAVDQAGDAAMSALEDWAGSDFATDSSSAWRGVIQDSVAGAWIDNFQATSGFDSSATAWMDLSGDWNPTADYSQVNPGDWEGYNEWITEAAENVIVDLVMVGNSMSNAWVQYHEAGYFGGSVNSDWSLDPESGAYGCTGVPRGEVFDNELTLMSGGDEKNPPTAHEWLNDWCYSSSNGFDVGEHHVAHDAHSHLIGGSFFSPVLGSYDAFMAHIAPQILCDGDSASVGGKHGVWYLYLVHGWGESAEVLVEVHPVLTFMVTALEHSRPGMGLANIVTFVVNDMSCPFGGKTWYTNNIFTGYHIDLIAFDLPAYAESTLGLASIGKGLYGFSMGGFGTINILLTYPKLFFGGAAFNAVLDADPCMHYGYCHLYCGVDSLHCDIKWTTTHVGMLPYVRAVTSGIASSQGYYDPMSYGVANKLSQKECVAGGIVYSGLPTTDHAHVVLASDVVDGQVAPHPLDPYVGPMGPNFHMQLTLSFSDAVQVADDFFLDIVQFTMAAQHFEPTFVQTEGPSGIRHEQWNNYMMRWPVKKTVYNNVWGGVPVFVLIACDANDPYNLREQANALGYNYGVGSGPQDIHQVSGIGNNPPLDLGRKGGMILDTDYAECGHCMSMRDFYVAYLFFADIFDTWTFCSVGGTEASQLASARSWGSEAQMIADSNKGDCYFACSSGDGPLCHDGLRQDAGKNDRQTSGVAVTTPTVGTYYQTQYLTVEAMAVSNVPSRQVHVSSVAAEYVSGGGGKACFGIVQCAESGTLPQVSVDFSNTVDDFLGDANAYVGEVTSGMQYAADFQADNAALTAEFRGQYETPENLVTM
jgi:hypothetical protein